MLVEIVLRQSRGESLRIGTLASAGVRDVVRIDGRDDWVVVRSASPRLAGTQRRLICEHRTALPAAA
jgi:hypothetical protein